MRSWRVASSFVVGLSVAACSATGSRGQFTAASSGAGGSGGGTGMGGNTNLGAGFATSTGAGTGGAAGDGCTAAAELVYVLSTDNNIWSFDPPSKTFTFLFPLTCATPTDGNNWGPNSMAVSRDAVAWVNYVGTDTSLGMDAAGVIFQVDINSGTCEATPSVTLQDPSFYRLGMGFSSDTVGGTSETLYVAGTGTAGMNNSPGLAKVDLTNFTVVPIGPFTGALSGQSAELTGTGDAKLYGFFTFLNTVPKPPVHVTQIDKANGSTPAATDVTLSQVPSPSDWAFSFWGGDFYLYTSGGKANTNVVHYSPASQAVDTMYVPNAGFIVVGAGVSTCAPLKPPN